MGWKYKTDSRGNLATAVKKRISQLEKSAVRLPVPGAHYDKIDLNSHESRAEFGYVYLEFVDDYNVDTRI